MRVLQGIRHRSAASKHPAPGLRAGNRRAGAPLRVANRRGRIAHTAAVRQRAAGVPGRGGRDAAAAKSGTTIPTDGKARTGLAATSATRCWRAALHQAIRETWGSSGEWLSLGLDQPAWLESSGLGAESEDRTCLPVFDRSQIERYVLRRVFELGWTTERFGSFDGSWDIDEIGSPSKESIGRKYQWIAYWEILALICRPLPVQRVSCGRGAQSPVPGTVAELAARH